MNLIGKLPEDAVELKTLSVELPRLKDGECQCPVDLEHIAEYVSVESGARTEKEDLNFLRTARLNDTSYWVWSANIDGENCYIAVSLHGRDVDVGYMPNDYDLSPEQFLVGDYFKYF